MKSTVFNVHDLVLLFTAIQSLLLAAFSLYMPRQRVESMRLLCVFFVANALYYLTSEFLWNGELAAIRSAASSLLMVVCCVATLLLGPALWFYLRAFTSKAFKLTRRDAIHLAPAIFVPLIALVIGITSEDMVTEGIAGPFSSASSFLWGAMRLSLCVYGLMSLHYVWNIRNDFQENFPWVHGLGVEWLMAMVAGFSLVWGWSFLVYLVGGVLPPLVPDILGITSNYMAFMLINGLFFVNFYFSMRLLREREKLQAARSQKTEVKADDIDKIMSLITEQKVYCQKNLTIEKFAEQVGLPVKEVSQTINAHFEANFVEFINTHRVYEVQRLLRMDEHKDSSIAKLYYMAGFNSKSSFQRFFKRVAGVSPTEYREQNLAT